MNISAGTSQITAETDFAWFERHRRRARMRLPLPGELRTVPPGMVPATFAMLTAEDVLIRLPLAVESGVQLERLSEADCMVVLDRLKRQDGRVERALAEAASGRAH